MFVITIKQQLFLVNRETMHERTPKVKVKIIGWLWVVIWWCRGYMSLGRDEFWWPERGRLGVFLQNWLCEEVLGGSVQRSYSGRPHSIIRSFFRWSKDSTANLVPMCSWLSILNKCILISSPTLEHTVYLSLSHSLYLAP